MGLQLVAKARQIVEQLGVNSLRGLTDGSWKRRYNINQLKVSDELGDVHVETVVSWMDILKITTYGT